MFTGIIEAVGKVLRIDTFGNDKRFYFNLGELSHQAMQLGDSIAVNGVCLTAISFDAQSFAADVSVETLSCTTVGTWHIGQRVNLERAVTPTTRLGGHLVSGHVDGLALLQSRKPDQRSVRLQFSLPKELQRYVAKKGSICIDGISLTVNEIHAEGFEVNIVPHTLAKTTLDAISVGDRVNIEVDVIARYVERMLGCGHEKRDNISASFLAEHGYLK